MTLSAWIRPSEPQSGWRTILHRQTDAYFLMASGGGGSHRSLGSLDYMLASVLVGDHALVLPDTRSRATARVSKRMMRSTRAPR